ncbi:MAG: CYTH domain-containing protein [Candidatus Hydrogenedentota bacterium]|nr:MAG: CYTH domain-containing protein [Candidatus Hydrogenedentota bacterium]
MASLFECEVRYKIEDIEVFEERLRELGAAVLYPYEYTDYYFEPAKDQWNPLEKSLRIREWKTPAEPTTIYFVKNEIVSVGDTRFKRALYPEGKVPLFSGDFCTCKSIIEDLGFQLWLVINKAKAKLWEIPEHGFKTAVEYIEHLGWTGELEFEGDNIARAGSHIEKALKTLRISQDLVSFKPVSVIVAEKMEIL